MEIQGVNTTNNDLFPYSALRVLGGLQIFTGATCVILGMFDVTILMTHYDEEASRYGVSPRQKAEFDTLVSLTVASAPIWCGMWYLVTGSLGTCVTRNRSYSLKFLKIAFLVLSVLCSAFFAPACIVLSCMIAVIRHTLDYGNLQWLVPTTAAFLSVCEMGLAVLSAAVCCCCSPLKMAKVHILFADSALNDGPNGPNVPQAQEEMRPSRATTRILQPSTVPPVSVREAKVQTDPRERASIIERVSVPRRDPEAEVHRDRRLADPRYPVLQRFAPEPEYTHPASSSGSVGYSKLKRWAFPQDGMYWNDY